MTINFDGSLHSDDPSRPGNLSALEYERRQRARAKEFGDEGLHTIPDDVLEAAIARAKELHP